MNKAIALIALISIAISGCGKETDADKIADAQACLDQATPSNVSECVDKVAGVSGKGAELIRCVAVYIKQNKTAAATLSSLFTALDSSSGNPNQNLMIGMEAIVFTAGGSASANKSDAADAAEYCNASNSPGLAMLSTLTLTGTVIAGGLAGGDVDGNIASCATNPASCSDADKALIGTAANLAYQQNCTGGADSAGDLCTQLGAVVSSGNTTQIGDKLIQCLNNRTLPGCTGF